MRVIGAAVVAVFVFLAVGCSGAAIQTDSASRAFESLTFVPSHRVLDSRDLRDGGREYVLATTGDLRASGVSAPGYSEVASARNAKDVVVMLRGPDPSPGRSGECSLTVYGGGPAPAGLAAGEQAYRVTSECATKPSE